MKTLTFALKTVELAHKAMKPGWYASSASIGLRSGPLKTEKEARECMRLSAQARAAQRLTHGTDYPHPFDLLVWKE